MFVSESMTNPDNNDVAAAKNERLRRSLEDLSTRDASERICTVTEGNIPTEFGHLRSEVRLHNLWHRATYVVVRHDPEDGGEGPDDCEEEDRILVQRRSLFKDYCPGLLDPAPGGVVGFCEDRGDNARREMMEEMGIDAIGTPGGEPPAHSLRRMFAFPYEDSRVRCWGDLYELTYRGKLNDLVLQEEEVDEVLCLPLSGVEKMAAEGPANWTPDGLHALRLYLQRTGDERVRRRLLKGYSSGDLESYQIRPKPRAVFFDCDDCLYFDGWGVARGLTERIERRCVDRVGLPEGEAYRMYKEHGTALKGLLAEGHMDNCDRAIDEYLRDVHDLPIGNMLSRDDELRKMLLRMDPAVPRFVFTASVREHAERCLKALGVSDLFVDIIDVKTCGLATKHSAEAFRAAMKVADIEEDCPEACVFLDDSPRNIEAAREMGWRSVLVGLRGRDCGRRVSSEHAEHDINRIHDLPSVLPELFVL